MPQESPTGGALAQVAIRELDMLQATLGNLDTAQSPSEVRRVIKQVKDHFARLGKVMDGANVEVPPPAPATDTPAAPGQPMPGTAPPQPGAPAARGTRYRVGPGGALIPVQQ